MHPLLSWDYLPKKKHYNKLYVHLCIETFALKQIIIFAPSTVCLKVWLYDGAVLYVPAMYVHYMRHYNITGL